MRRVIASHELSAADARLAAADPARGARRREGMLLAAYALLFLIGVWTVAVSELSPQEPSSLHPSTVRPPTQGPQHTGK